MIRCGIRVGEISNLGAEDVILKGRSGHVVIRDHKTGSERSVPATEPVRSALRKYFEIRGSALNNEPLFLSQRGNRISVQSVKYLAKKYLCAAGRPDLSARDIRHHMAQKLYQKKKDLALLQKTLGHKHLSTTARYVHRNKK
jgi:site-specific recombinase XerD